MNVKLLTRYLQPDYEADEARELAFRVIEYLSGKSRSDILRQQVEVPEDERLTDILSRLKQHEPIQYIIGVTDWMGLRLKVTPATLIPRPETAELVDRVCADVAQMLRVSCRVLDIGTGSGCIAIALKQRHPEWEVTAMDISPEALDVARQNAKANGVDVNFIEQDVLADFQFEQFDIVVSNPPYVRFCDEIGKNVKLFEPASALFVPDDDPLIFYRRIVELKIGKQLYFEVNELLAEEVAETMKAGGYSLINIYKDIYGKQRIVSGRLSK